MELEKRGLDAILVTDIKSIRYLTGFTGSSAYLILAVDKGWFLTDSRYETQAADEVKGLKVRIYKKALDEVSGLVTSLKLRTLGFESNNISYDTYLKLKKALPGVRLKAAPGIAGKGRQRKDTFEIERIRESARILDSGYDIAKEILEPGAVEKRAAIEIEFAFREAGADSLAFDMIIASGFRGALPHGKASGKKIKRGELVVVDMGVLKDGYNSDETRTYCIGRPTALQKRVYRIVKDAQSYAIEKIRPGVAALEVDKAARGYIERSGYGKHFGHGTGHGVGLEIHEAPSISPISKDVLEEGMVITIEPGIYLPGEFGVRIEDMALVVKDGYEILTKTPRDFVCL